ncbi:hypothetical protein [Flagellimonas olearia]
MENRSNLICPMCRGNFIAVLNHQTPHFKHKPNNDCKGNFESYIHWLTKVLFKQLKEIEIPELLIEDLPEKKRQYFQFKKNSIIDSKLPFELRDGFMKGLKKCLNDSRKLVIDSVALEQEFKTSLGNIRVDVVVESNGKKLFIEPFYTNKIGLEKRDKLSKMGVPTLSLDLFEFKNHFGSNFSIQLLKKYLYVQKSKSWEYLSNEEYDNHIRNYEKYLLDEIEKNKPLINQIYLDEIKALEDESESHIKKIEEEHNEIIQIGERIKKLKRKLNGEL